MQAGLLNEVIRIERNHLHKNEYGEETQVWELHTHTRARIDWKGGDNTIQNDERVFTRQLNFIIRYYHDVRNSDRIIWKWRKYRILYIEEHKHEQRKIVFTELINE